VLPPMMTALMRNSPVHMPFGRLPCPQTDMHVMVMTPPQILAILGAGGDVGPHSAIAATKLHDGEIGASGARNANSHGQHAHGEYETLHRSSSLVLPPQYLSDITPSLATQARTAKYVSEMRRELEDIMPEVVVYMLEGRTLDQKRGLIQDITAAVVKNAGAQPDAVTVSLVESPKTSKGKGGVLFSEMQSR
jgi:4-oxalocrotonate tautomerase